MERKMAHIETISNIQPIPGADRIEVASLLGWQIVVKKEEFKVGDKVIYIEIDSLVDPKNPYFDFMAERKYRVRSIKLRKQISQGLIVPMSLLPLPEDRYEVGQDVSKELKITKYDDEYEAPQALPLAAQEMRLRQRHKRLSRNPLFKRLMKFAWFRKFAFAILLPKKKKNGWPIYIQKTDEDRIQNCLSILQNKEPFITTVKCDGTSSTYSLKKEGRGYRFYVCSRNVVQDTPDRKCFYDENYYWQMAEKYHIEEVLCQLIGDHDFITLQGETCGPGINGNRMLLKEIDLFAFNLITPEKKYNAVEMEKILKPFGIKIAPILGIDYVLPDTLEELMAYSTFKSPFCDALAEGVVFRNQDCSISFKCVSNDYLLKHGI